MAEPIRIGVLALQGAFIEHVATLNRIEGVSATAVRTAEELAGLDGLVIPGGESTTMGLVAERSGVLPTLRGIVKDDKIPVFATCAGLIMLGDKALHTKGGGQPLIGGLHVVVDRNHFGSQLQSFETELDADKRVMGDEGGTCRAVFIRAPAIVEVLDPSVEVLATLEDGDSGKSVVVAAKQENMLVTAFHPELTPDSRWHRYFVENMVRGRKGEAK